MPYRKPHGNARKLGIAAVYEQRASDEQRPALADPTAPIEHRPNGTYTSAGAAEAARRRWALHREKAIEPDFAAHELQFVPSAGFAPFNESRVGALEDARRQLTLETRGPISEPVQTILRGWSWIWAFAEFYAFLAAKTDDGKASDKAGAYFAKASVEYQKARDTALAEAAARPRAAALPPWFVPAKEPTKNG